jgi:hypothetical protein
MIRKHIKTLDDEYVSFTGRAWMPRSEIRKLVRRMGGDTTPRYAVTKETTILVRGSCAIWKYGDFGAKERRAAELVRLGHPIALVHDFEFKNLVEHRRAARVSDRLAGQPAEWLREPTEQRFERVAASAGPLDREFSAKGRTEQAFLRHQLFGAVDAAECCLCGRRLPTSLLVAAHIKPRSECSRRERLDAKNVVFSLCLLGCDVLYERGLVAVRSGGGVRFSKADGGPSLNRILMALAKRRCSAWSETSAQYFDWHLNNRFQG